MIRKGEAHVRKLALSFEGAGAVVDADRAVFRTKREIFGTLPPDEQALNLMFDPLTQEFFCEQAPDVIAPLPGRWGRRGMARCDLKAADEAHALALPKAKKAAKRKPKQ
jgi:hypothetical protein